MCIGDCVTLNWWRRARSFVSSPPCIITEIPTERLVRDEIDFNQYTAAHLVTPTKIPPRGSCCEMEMPSARIWIQRPINNKALTPPRRPCSTDGDARRISRLRKIRPEPCRPAGRPCNLTPISWLFETVGRASFLPQLAQLIRFRKKLSLGVGWKFSAFDAP